MERLVQFDGDVSTIQRRRLFIWVVQRIGDVGTVQWRRPNACGIAFGYLRFDPAMPVACFAMCLVVEALCYQWREPWPRWPTTQFNITNDKDNNIISCSRPSKHSFAHSHTPTPRPSKHSFAHSHTHTTSITHSSTRTNHSLNQ